LLPEALLLWAAAAAPSADEDDLPDTADMHAAGFMGLAVAAEAGLLQSAELLPA
jgi:hypothetical protein